MTVDIWGPIAMAEWQDTPFIVGKPASEQDIEAGIAVFAVPTGSIPYDISLPTCAIHFSEDKSETPILVIQAEAVDGVVFIGARLLSGGNMVCTLEEVELLSGPDQRFK